MGCGLMGVSVKTERLKSVTVIRMRDNGASGNAEKWVLRGI